MWPAGTVASFAGKCDNTKVICAEDAQIVTVSKGKTWEETINLFLEYCPSLQYSSFAVHCTKTKYCQRITQGSPSQSTGFTQGLNKRLWQNNACPMPLLNTSQRWECLNFLVNLMFIRDLFIWSLWLWDQCPCLMDFILASNPRPVLPWAFLCWDQVTNLTHQTRPAHGLVWERCYAHGIAWCLTCSWPGKAIVTLSRLCSSQCLCITRSVSHKVQPHLVSSSWPSNLCFPPSISVWKPEISGLFLVSRGKQKCTDLWHLGWSTKLGRRLTFGHLSPHILSFNCFLWNAL